VASPSIQSNEANLGAGGSGTVTFTGAQTSGNTNVVAVWVQNNQVSTAVPVPTDSSGNTYVLAVFQDSVGGSNGVALWLFVCIGIAAHGAGNVVNITFPGGTFCDAIIVEYPPTGAVRTSNGNNRFGGGTAPISTTLSGTSTNDLVVMTSWANNVAVSGAGTVGANTANVVQTSTDPFVVQDGLSDGSSPMTVVCGAIVDDFWTIAALAFKQPGPTITSQPQNITVYAGQTATLSVTATSSGGSLSYQWNLNGTPIGGATSSSYTTPATSLSDSGSVFTVTVTDSNGSVLSHPAVLTVLIAASLFWIRA
jgi:hypothetical protein